MSLVYGEKVLIFTEITTFALSLMIRFWALCCSFVCAKEISKQFFFSTSRYTSFYVNSLEGGEKKEKKIKLNSSPQSTLNEKIVLRDIFFLVVGVFAPKSVRLMLSIGEDVKATVSRAWKREIHFHIQA